MLAKTFAIAAALLLIAAPLALAHDSTTGSTAVSPNPGCWSTQNPHDFVGGAGLTSDSNVRSGGVGLSTARDSNAEDCDGDGERGDFDGDYEFGAAGGFFPAGPWAADTTCDYGLTPHHGPTFHVHSEVPDESTEGLFANFTVGSDPTPPTLVPSADPEDDDGFDCVTDGSITPETDADDCLESFDHVGTTTCAAGGDGGYFVWVWICKYVLYIDPAGIEPPRCELVCEWVRIYGHIYAS